MRSDRSSVLVVGGGVFGLTAAIELRRRGWSVRLLEAGSIPCESASSTDISKAVRMDYGSDAFHMELAEHAVEGWEKWNRGVTEPLYLRTGFLLMSRVRFEAGGFEADSYDLLRRRGHRPQRIDADALSRRFPAWCTNEYVDGYFNPDAGWSPSGRVVAWLAEKARVAGVRIDSGTPVVRLIEEGSRIVGVETRSGDRLAAGTVLVAAGAWTPRLLPALGAVMWPTGQSVLHFRPADPVPYEAKRFPVWAADISRTGWYGFPENDGIVKVANHGAGRRISPDDGSVVLRQDEERFRSFLGGTFPELARAPVVGARLCFYCDTVDGDFWIDHDPSRRGLVVAAGGSGHGFKFAPVLGPIIADVVEHRANRHAPRFAWRSPDPGRKEQARHRPG